MNERYLVAQVRKSQFRARRERERTTRTSSLLVLLVVRRERIGTAKEVVRSDHHMRLCRHRARRASTVAASNSFPSQVASHSSQRELLAGRLARAQLAPFRCLALLRASTAELSLKPDHRRRQLAVLHHTKEGDALDSFMILARFEFEPLLKG